MRESLYMYKKLMQYMSQIQNKNTFVASTFLSYIFYVLAFAALGVESPTEGPLYQVNVEIRNV